MFLSFLAAGGFFYLAVRGVSLTDTLRTLREANLGGLGLACVGLMAGYCLRGVRWGLLLGNNSQIGYSKVLSAMMVGYLGNTFLPARAGEVLRSFLLARSAGVGVSFIFATIVSERVIDAIALVLIAASTMIFLTELPSWLPGSMLVAGILGTTILIMLLTLPRLEGPLLGLIQRLPMPGRVKPPSVELVSQFIAGIRRLYSPRRGLALAALTATIWLVDASVGLSVAWALNLTLSLPQMLLLLAALGLASGIALTPGYIGVFEFVAVTVLVPMGLTEASALAFMLAYRATAYVTVTMLGLAGYWRLIARHARSPVKSEPEIRLIGLD